METILGTIGTGCIEVPKELKVIWFEVSLFDLVIGGRPLPHCFGNVPQDDMWAASNGSLQCTINHKAMVPAPSLETLIPVDKRRQWLEECFMECVLIHWGRIIVKKNGGRRSGQPDYFLKGFKKIMQLPHNYKLSETDLFIMFLKELKVKSLSIREKHGYSRRSQNIDELCQKRINLLD